MLKYFAEKMWVAFAVQKLLTFFQQNISEYCVLTVNEMTLNELVKLTTLWTTGPWLTNKCITTGFVYKICKTWSEYFLYFKLKVY